MKAAKILILLVAVAVGAAAIKWMIRRPTPVHAVAEVGNQISPEPQKPEEPNPRTVIPVSNPEADLAEFTTTDSSPPKTMGLTNGTTSTLPPTPAKRPKEPLRDPEARLAMSLVGIDPEAEGYWLEAIFDASLPAKEREDLMEDLNEDGLSDYKHPGPQDLPVILNRLAIIEEILPHADEFMVRHLGEAYKDLVNLASITQGGGVPVR